MNRQEKEILFNAAYNENKQDHFAYMAREHYLQHGEDDKADFEGFKRIKHGHALSVLARTFRELNIWDEYIAYVEKRRKDED